MKFWNEDTQTEEDQDCVTIINKIAVTLKDGTELTIEVPANRLIDWCTEDGELHIMAADHDDNCLWTIALFAAGEWVSLREAPPNDEEVVTVTQK